MNCILLDSDWKFVATMHCSGSALSCIILHSVALEMMACSSVVLSGRAPLCDINFVVAVLVLPVTGDTIHTAMDVPYP
jgi:hypothetical protein